MSIETSATKLYLRELPPLQVHDLLEKYKIPTPYKEVLLGNEILEIKSRGL